MGNSELLNYFSFLTGLKLPCLFPHSVEWQIKLCGCKLVRSCPSVEPGFTPEVYHSGFVAINLIRLKSLFK